MDYDFDNHNDKYSTSSSSSTTSESFINNLKTKTLSPINSKTNVLNLINNNNNISSTNEQNYFGNNYNPSLPNSCSLIFSTAASFNINQNDTVFYSRESIHLLAKFLANNSELNIFRSLYSYAPDNLAWLWSFLDFDTPLDLTQVPVQDVYEPFELCLQDNSLTQQDDDLLNRINKIYSDSPLIQYKYRENLMIADLYKFLEHLQKVNLKYIAISLFSLYFPRFSCFMDDQIKPFLRPKILTSNLPLIKELDTMIVRLIKSRYTNLNEYKQKILTGNGLPSYVKSLLNDASGFWTNPSNKILIHTLTTSLNSTSQAKSPSTQHQQQLNRTPIQNKLINEFSQQDEKSLYQTLSYLKLLQKSTKINSDLDHTEEDAIQEDELEQEELKSILNSQLSQFPVKLNEISSPSLLEQSYYMNFANVTNDDNLSISNQNHNKSNLIISSPNGYTSVNQNLANKILVNTPQTPSSLNPYLDTSSLWSNNLNQTKLSHRHFLNSTLTPPSSACLKNKLELNLDDDHFNTLSPLTNNLDPLLMTPSNHMNEDQLSKYFNNSAIISSPVPKYSKLNDYSNYVGSSNLINNNSSNALIGNLNSHAQSTKYFNDLSIKTNSNNNYNLAQTARSPLAGTRSPVYSNLLPNTNHTWCGRLPPKIYSISSLFSRKVFLGGLPWDVNQQYLLQLLHKYGSVKLEIPGKDLKHPRVSNMNKMQERSTPGYVYIIFDHESAVQRMLADCRREFKNGGEHYFYNIFIPNTYQANNFNQIGYGNNNFMKRGKSKEVEVIPWNQDDTSYVPLKLKDLPPKIDPKCTIFVGALHGMLNAQGLGKVMTEIFGEVIHAGLDTDKYKYPIGSGRVTFRDRASYVKAIKAKFVTIKANLDPSDPSPKFEKTIQIDPYLEDAKCSQCDSKSFYFCRNECCLDYYCMHCWSFRHDTKNNGEHVPLSRQNKPTHG